MTLAAARPASSAGGKFFLPGRGLEPSAGKGGSARSCLGLGPFFGGPRKAKLFLETLITAAGAGGGGETLE